jgi:hypothetical protein
MIAQGRLTRNDRPTLTTRSASPATPMPSDAIAWALRGGCSPAWTTWDIREEVATTIRAWF